MSIKILGGLLKGQSLFVPAGDLIRPTSVRLKRRLFDSLQDWSELLVVDLCCGSGSVGFEMWSRGAQKTILVEINKQVFSVLKKNKSEIEGKFSLHTKERPIELCQLGAFQWLKKNFDQINTEDTVIFFDPPYYEHKTYDQVCNFLLSENDFKGKLIVESDRQKGPSEDYWKKWEANTIKKYEQGTSFFLILSC